MFHLCVFGVLVWSAFVCLFGVLARQEARQVVTAVAACLLFVVLTASDDAATKNPTFHLPTSATFTLGLTATCCNAACGGMGRSLWLHGASDIV